jgi:hypothetical protein
LNFGGDSAVWHDREQTRKNSFPLLPVKKEAGGSRYGLWRGCPTDRCARGILAKGTFDSMSEHLTESQRYLAGCGWKKAPHHCFCLARILQIRHIQKKADDSSEIIDSAVDILYDHFSK